MTKSNEQNGQEQQTKEKEICGIIMPIADTDGYSKGHWQEVKLLLERAISAADFIPKIVSDSEDISIIHNSIVNNIYENPIVVCDVSSKNPNVMFELGMRLAFDKPTIIVKDNITSYSFDTGIIEHLTYPADLHILSVESFMLSLQKKITSTYEASKKSDYSFFLKNFVKYKKKLGEEEVSSTELILKEIQSMKGQINRLNDNVDDYKPYLGSRPAILKTTNEIIVSMINRYLNSKPASQLGNNKDDFKYKMIKDLKLQGINVDNFQDIINEVSDNFWREQPKFIS